MEINQLLPEVNDHQPLWITGAFTDAVEGVVAEDRALGAGDAPHDFKAQPDAAVLLVDTETPQEDA